MAERDEDGASGGDLQSQQAIVVKMTSFERWSGGELDVSGTRRMAETTEIWDQRSTGDHRIQSFVSRTDSY